MSQKQKYPEQYDVKFTCSKCETDHKDFLNREEILFGWDFDVPSVCLECDPACADTVTLTGKTSLDALASEPGQLDYPGMPQGFEKRLWYRFTDLAGMIDTAREFSSDEGVNFTLGLLLVTALVEGYLYGLDDVRNTLDSPGKMPPKAILPKAQPTKAHW